MRQDYGIRPFRFKLKTKIIFGVDTFSEAAGEVLNFGKSALIVTTVKNPHLASALAELQKALEGRGIKSSIADDISPNPKVEEINLICKSIRGKWDCVIGMGGGSSIDAAKAIAILLGNKEKDIGVYLSGKKEPPHSTLPILAIPTTAGSGSEVTAAAIVTCAKEGIKSGIRGEAIVPSVAVIDPMLTLSAPYELTKISGFDVFTHAIESFVSKKSNLLSDMVSREAIAIVVRVLPRLLRNLNDITLRSEMSFASLIAGINLLYVGTCMPHRLQYPLGASTDMPHGVGLAVIYPEWLERLEKAGLKKLSEISLIFGEKDKHSSPIRRITKFMKEDLGLEKSIKRPYYTPGIDDLVARVEGGFENDPVYSRGAAREVYKALFKKGTLRCRQ